VWLICPQRSEVGPLHRVIGKLDGWAWVEKMFDTWDLSLSSPKPPLLLHRSEYYAEETSFASVRVQWHPTDLIKHSKPSTLIFFQDHDQWIRCGAFDDGCANEVLIKERIVQAAERSPLAACVGKPLLVWVGGRCIPSPVVCSLDLRINIEL
jgi:hypothetical protein